MAAGTANAGPEGWSPKRVDGSPIAIRSAEPVVVPTEMCRGYFFVPVVLGSEEADRDRTLWFLYDTGATTTYVDPDSLERVSGQRVAVGRRANVLEASAGRVNFRRLRARVRDLDHLSTTLGREIDGIMAFGVFDEYLLTLDYAAGEMRIESGALPEADGETVFSASGPDERPWLEVRIGERRRRMLIDSGAASSTFVIRDLDGYRSVAPPRAIGSSTRFRHVELRRGARLDGDVLFATHRLVKPTLAETEDTELIGGAVLRHFVLTFDQVRKRVRIVRSDPEVPISFPPFVSHGMVLVPRGDALVVHDVVEGGPAAAAGIRAGDRVTHFAGRPVATRGCDPLPRDELAVSIVRDGEPRVMKVRLFPLIQ